MNYEAYQIPQGIMTIIQSNKELSVGLLELNPNQKLTKHNRPVNEELLQLTGTTEIIKDNETIILQPGDRLKIPAEEYHIHSNPSHKTSVTLWKFKGDITEIINNIRRNNENI